VWVVYYFQTGISLLAPLNGHYMFELPQYVYHQLNKTWPD